MFGIARTILIGCCLISMTACSSGPSDAEVEAAMKARINDMDPGDPSAPKVDSAKNNGCVSTGVESKYTCEVEVELTLPMVGRMKNVGQ